MRARFPKSEHFSIFKKGEGWSPASPTCAPVYYTITEKRRKTLVEMPA